MMIPEGNELRILELLQERGPMCGVQLQKADATLKKGSVYNVMRRMMERGYIECWVEAREGTRGLGVRMAKITDRGKSQMERAHRVALIMAGSVV